MRPPIYTPSGPALEYAQHGLNIYDSCPHGCTYCYAAAMAKRFGSPWNGIPAVRQGLLCALDKQLDRQEWRNAGRLIHLCFTCDPYPWGCDTAATRAVIKAIKESGNHVQILTKGDPTAQRDFDLLDGNDSFGITLTGAKPYQEPGAVSHDARIRLLRDAAAAGVPTWVSCEPVIDPRAIEDFIFDLDFVGMWRIGKLNQRKSNIDWRQFGLDVEALCKRLGRTYDIKKDLRAAMNKGRE